MMSSGQLRAARAFIGLSQQELADVSAVSLPTIRRMENSDGVVRSNVDSLMKVITALELAGVELIAENEPSASGGRGVRLLK